MFSCHPRATHYQSGSLETARTAFSLRETITRELLDDAKEKAKPEDIEWYKAILDQEFQFNPPVKILLIIPPAPRYSWWHYYGYPNPTDSMNLILHKSLAEKFMVVEFVSEIELASSLFGFGTLNSLREIAARYRADECLFISYDLMIRQPTSCLGFWPGTYLHGMLSSESMLIDTRTGFFLTGQKYYFEKKSGSGTHSFSSKELEIMQLIADEWAEKIVAVLTEFYRSESK